MPRLNLRQLRALGFEWPPGPVTPPENEEEAFDLSGEAMGCEALYHDYKGDTRYLDQKPLFEELAAKVDRATRGGTKMPDVTKVTPPFTLPITRRKLQTIACEWPFPYPEGLDDPIDVVGGIDRLEYIDIHEYTGGRQSYLQHQLTGARRIEEKLAELGILTRSKPAASPSPSPARPPSPPPAPAPARPPRSITRRKLKDLGISLSFDEDVPFALDAPIAAEELRHVVLDHPDDDAPRLAYAAALGDADPRAQLIRIQCEAASLPSWSPRRRVLEGQFIKLAVAHRAAWEGDLRGLVKYSTFRRGFIERIEIDGAAFAKNAERIFAKEPVREVECAREFAELAGSPALRRLRRLDCAGDTSALMTSPHLDGLRDLWLSKGRVGDAFTTALSSGALRLLENLRIWELEDVEHIAAALPKATAIPALSDLTLRGAPLDEPTMRALAESELAPRLRSLHVRIASKSAASALARGDYRALARLDVDGTTLAPPSALASLRAPNLEMLQLFSLSSFGVEDAKALAGIRFDRLRELTITGSSFDAAAFEVLATAPWIAGLEHIHLRGAALFASTTASLLSRLGHGLRALEIEAVDSDGLADALARSPAAPHLEVLRVENAIHERELGAVLARAPKLRGLYLARQWQEPNALQADVLRAAGFVPCGGEKGCYVREVE